MRFLRSLLQIYSLFSLCNGYGDVNSEKTFLAKSVTQLGTSTLYDTFENGSLTLDMTSRIGSVYFTTSVSACGNVDNLNTIQAATSAVTFKFPTQGLYTLCFGAVGMPDSTDIFDVSFQVNVYPAITYPIITAYIGSSIWANIRNVLPNMGFYYSNDNCVTRMLWFESASTSVNVNMDIGIPVGTYKLCMVFSTTTPQRIGSTSYTSTDLTVLPALTYSPNFAFIEGPDTYTVNLTAYGIDPTYYAFFIPANDVCNTTTPLTSPTLVSTGSVVISGINSYSASINLSGYRYRLCVSVTNTPEYHSPLFPTLQFNIYSNVIPSSSYLLASNSFTNLDLSTVINETKAYAYFSNDGCATVAIDSSVLVNVYDTIPNVSFNTTGQTIADGNSTMCINPINSTLNATPLPNVSTQVINSIFVDTELLAASNTYAEYNLTIPVDYPPLYAGWLPPGYSSCDMAESQFGKQLLDTTTQKYILNDEPVLTTNYTLCVSTQSPFSRYSGIIMYNYNVMGYGFVPQITLNTTIAPGLQVQLSMPVASTIRAYWTSQNECGISYTEPFSPITGTSNIFTWTNTPAATESPLRLCISKYSVPTPFEDVFFNYTTLLTTVSSFDNPLTNITEMYQDTIVKIPKGDLDGTKQLYLSPSSNPTACSTNSSNFFSMSNNTYTLNTTGVAVGSYSVCYGSGNATSSGNAVLLGNTINVVAAIVPDNIIYMNDRTSSVTFTNLLHNEHYYFVAQLNNCSAPIASYPYIMSSTTTNVAFGIPGTPSLPAGIYNICFTQNSVASANYDILVNWNFIIYKPPVLQFVKINTLSTPSLTIPTLMPVTNTLLYYYVDSTQSSCSKINMKIGPLMIGYSAVTLGIPDLNSDVYTLCIGQPNDVDYYIVNSTVTTVNNFTPVTSYVFTSGVFNLDHTGVPSNVYVYYTDATCDTGTVLNNEIYPGGTFHTYNITTPITPPAAYNMCLSGSGNITNRLSDVQATSRQIIMGGSTTTPITVTAFITSNNVTFDTTTLYKGNYYYWVPANSSSCLSGTPLNGLTYVSPSDTAFQIDLTGVTQGGTYNLCMCPTGSQAAVDTKIELIKLIVQTQVISPASYTIYSIGTFEIDLSGITGYVYFVPATSTTCNTYIVGGVIAPAGNVYRFEVTSFETPGLYIMCSALTNNTANLSANILVPGRELTIVGPANAKHITAFQGLTSVLDFESIETGYYYYWVLFSSNLCSDTTTVFPIQQINQSSITNSFTGIPTGTYMLCFSTDNIQSSDDTLILTYTMKVNPEISTDKQTYTSSQSGTYDYSSFDNGIILYYVDLNDGQCGNASSYFPSFTVTSSEKQVTYDLINVPAGRYVLCIYTNDLSGLSSLSLGGGGGPTFSSNDIYNLNVEIVVAKSEPTDKSWASKYWYIILIIVIIFVAILWCLFFVLRRRRNKENKSGNIREVTNNISA